MKCKDIPDRPILEFIASFNGAWTNWFNPRSSRFSVRHAMPELPSEKLALAKMRQLVRRGLVGGCPCGCRGDFFLTDKGRTALATVTPTPSAAK